MRSPPECFFVFPELAAPPAEAPTADENPEEGTQAWSATCST
jgi:hypothetical protein